MVPTWTSSQPEHSAFGSLPDSHGLQMTADVHSFPGGHSHQRGNNYINSNTIPLRFSVCSFFLLKYIFPVVSLKNNNILIDIFISTTGQVFLSPFTSDSWRGYTTACRLHGLRKSSQPCLLNPREEGIRGFFISH